MSLRSVSKAGTLGCRKDIVGTHGRLVNDIVGCGEKGERRMKTIP